MTRGKGGGFNIPLQEPANSTRENARGEKVDIELYNEKDITPKEAKTLEVKENILSLSTIVGYRKIYNTSLKEVMEQVVLRFRA